MTSAAARVVLDVGAGDGHASLRLARRDARSFAIALDASADRLRDGARTALRQGIGNALFVVAAVERLPRELDGVADAITVSFPWGSLLRGIVGAEPAVLGPLARAAKGDARVRVLLSVEPRDAAETALAPVDAASLASRRAAYERAGLAIERCELATPDEIAASGSTWAKRLGTGRRVLALELRRLNP